MIEVKIKMTEGCEDLSPAYATDGSAAFDLKAANSTPVTIAPKECLFIPLELISEIPEGYAAFIYARSGLGGKQGIRPGNCVGVIDSDYRGKWGAFMRNDSDEPYTITYGDRICQAVIKKVEQVKLIMTNDLSETQRGSGGWGSTGK